MDLKKLNITEKAEEGSWCELEHPVTGETLDIRIKLAGIDSKTYREAARKQINKRLKKGLRKISIEDTEQEEIELLAACTLDWENVEYEGNVLECNPENVKFVYKEFPWIREQVDAFIADRGNYLKN